MAIAVCPVVGSLLVEGSLTLGVGPLSLSLPPCKDDMNTQQLLVIEVYSISWESRFRLQRVSSKDQTGSDVRGIILQSVTHETSRYRNEVFAFRSGADGNNKN